MKFVHRKIPKEKVIGFVLCDFGPLPCETAFDIEELKKFGQIYDWGIKTGRLKRNRGVLPQFVGGKSIGDPCTESELFDALQIVSNHALDNLGFFPTSTAIDGVITILKKSFSYRFGRRYFPINKVNAIVRKLTKNN